MRHDAVMATNVTMWDPTPVSQQIAAVLRERIQSGEYGPRDRLPSEKELQEEYGIARETARRVFRYLREEGLVVTLPGRGTYVPPESP
jgi:GntR family transcriptional regulator